MDSVESGAGFLPPALIDEIEALAAAQQRPANEVLRDAVESYVRVHRPAADSAPRRTPREAGERMLARRPFHSLPEGETIRDLINYGCA